MNPAASAPDASRAANPKVVLILSSQEKDYYAEMAAICAWMIRSVHPSLPIWLLVDEQTRPSLEQRRAEVLNYCDHVEVVPTGLPKPRERAWCIKSMMRQVVPGDFLFMDADALAIRPFDSIFRLDCDFAAVLDRHDPPQKYQPMKAEIALYKEVGWRFPPRYYNSGVVLFRDTPGAHRLGAEWQRRWRIAWQAGQIADQFSLNSALADLEVKITTLPARYNAQIMMKRSTLRGAAIVHIFSVAVGPDSDTALGQIAHRMKQTGKLDTDALRRMQQTGYPWADEGWISGQLAAGRYGAALLAAGKKLIGRRHRTTLGNTP